VHAFHTNEDEWDRAGHLPTEDVAVDEWTTLSENEELPKVKTIISNEFPERSAHS
jgi:hypothetical protein